MWLAIVLVLAIGVAIVWFKRKPKQAEAINSPTWNHKLGAKYMRESDVSTQERPAPLIDIVEEEPVEPVEIFQETAAAEPRMIVLSSAQAGIPFQVRNSGNTQIMLGNTEPRTIDIKIGDFWITANMTVYQSFVEDQT